MARKKKKRYLCFRISGRNAEIYASAEVLAWVDFQSIPSKIRAKAPLSQENYNANEEMALN